MRKFVYSVNILYVFNTLIYPEIVSNANYNVLSKVPPFHFIFMSMISMWKTYIIIVVFGFLHCSTK